MIMFLEQTIEIRPDVPETLFWLLSLLSMVQGIKTEKLKWYILSGAAISISILFSQKALFPLLGLAAAFIWLFLERTVIQRQAGSWRQTAKELLCFIMGFSVPIMLICFVFLIYGSLTEFVNLNLIINLRWKVRFSPFVFLKPSFAQNPFFWILGITGLFLATIRLRKRDERLRGNMVPLISTYFLLAGLFIIPVPYKEYHVMHLPLLAIYCAYGLKKALSCDFRKMSRKWDLIESIIGLLVFTFALGYTLLFIPVSFLNLRWPYIASWGFLLIIIILACLKKMPIIAILAVSIGILLYPFQQTLGQLKRSNAGQLADINYTMSVTGPEDTVMDGWSGFGVFRPHAYYYHFLHGEVRAMMSKEELEDNLIQNLREKRTKVIIYDSSVKALPEAVQDYIAAHYIYSGQGNIYLLNEILEKPKDG